LENTPAAYGSQNPVVLMLGFSGGHNQSYTVASNFNDRPFRGMRPRITQIFQKFGLLGLNERVDDRIHENERDFAFGSILRCSISKWDDGKQDWAKSGDVISSLSKDWRAQRFLSNCGEQFLKHLPPRLRLVILLSNDDSYTRMCRTIIQRSIPM